MPLKLAALVIVQFVCLVAVFPSVSKAQAVPAEAKRRLGQALWPTVLFDSLGVPTPGFRVRSFRGDPSHGFEVSVAQTDSALPSAVVYRGTAFRCFDCGVDRAAVVSRGGELITLAGPEDLETVLPVFIAPERADSALVHRSLLGLLRSSCILGCGARIITSRAQIPLQQLTQCRSAKGEAWTIVTPRVRTNGSFLEYELSIWAGEQVHRLSVAWSNKRFVVHASLVASCALQA